MQKCSLSQTCGSMIFYLYQLTGGNEFSLNVHHEVLPEPPILLEDEIY